MSTRPLLSVEARYPAKCNAVARIICASTVSYIKALGTKPLSSTRAAGTQPVVATR